MFTNWSSYFFSLSLFGLLLLSLSACEPSVPEGSKNIPLVVTTTSIIGDIAQNIAGDQAQVISLMGPGIDPHLYKPTRMDMARLVKAQLVLYNGLLLEGKMSAVLMQLQNERGNVYAVTAEIEKSLLLEPSGFRGHYDPHLWMDPLVWKSVVEAICSKLKVMDPVNSEFFSNNALRYNRELEGLILYAGQVLETVPQTSRVLVTAHDAFRYFGRRFSFDVVGIQGLSTESEAGVRDIEALVDLLVKRKVRAVFVESTVSARNIQALREGAKVRGQTVELGGQLFSDALGDAGTYEGTYLGMIDHNVTTIARALGGEAPSRGWKGLLRVPVISDEATNKRES